MIWRAGSALCISAGVSDDHTIRGSVVHVAIMLSRVLTGLDGLIAERSAVGDARLKRVARRFESLIAFEMKIVHRRSVESLKTLNDESSDTCEP